MITRMQTLTVVYFADLFYTLDFCHSSMILKYIIFLKICLFISERKTVVKEGQGQREKDRSRLFAGQGAPLGA